MNRLSSRLNKKSILLRQDRLFSFGVILKDGKKISFLGDAGGTGYNEAMTEAYTLSSFVQVIEPDQVQAIILRNDDGEQIEIPIR